MGTSSTKSNYDRSFKDRVVKLSYERKMVGWSLSDNLTARDTAVRAYQMAVKNRKISRG